MKILYEFFLAVIDAVIVIYLYQEPSLQPKTLGLPASANNPDAAVLVTIAKTLRPTLEGKNCLCYLNRGDRLEFLQIVSDKRYRVPGKDSFAYHDPLYKVLVLDSGNPECNELEGWVFGGYIVWEALVPHLIVGKSP